MEISTRSVFQKSDKGIDELKTRSHGLGSRLRQLLILIDGRRDFDELARMLPGPDLAEGLERLESDGFVVRSPDAAHPPPVTPAAAPAPAAVPAPADVAASPTVAAPAPPVARPASASRAASPPPHHPDAPVRGPDLPAMRSRVIRALLDSIGPNGDDFAIRIERARSVDELRALLPAVLSVVEACGGRKAVDGFLQRCGGAL